MITLLLIIICLGIFLYGSHKYAIERPQGFPPGPPKIPLFGSYLFMAMTNWRFSHKALLKFTEWYKSDIIGLYMGPLPIITVHNAEAVREVLFNTVYDGRVDLYPAQIRHPQGKISGIFFQDGPVWKDQRRFILRYMRDFGFGRRFQDLELVIQEQITDMMDLIRNGPKYKHEERYVHKNGYRILLPYFFNPFSANSVFHIMYNEVRPRSEQKGLWELVEMGMKFQRNNDAYGKILAIMPWVRYLFPNWIGYNQVMEANHFLYKFFDDVVERHVQTYDESYDRNFLDLYIREMKKAEDEGDTNSSFERNQLILSLIDFSFPAYTAVGMQLSFLIQYLLLYPEVQKRIHKEIDEVVGSGRLPTLDDRMSLHYTEATVREILRIETLVPSNVNHKALEDTELCGYKVPKGTAVMTSLYAFHLDKRVWGDPENFRPERFLDDEGKLCLKKDLSLPFGAGKRLCAGETFARNMLFLMTSAMCQNFNIILGPNDKCPDLNSRWSGLTVSPNDFWVQLEDRK